MLTIIVTFNLAHHAPQLNCFHYSVSVVNVKEDIASQDFMSGNYTECYLNIGLH